MSRIEPMPGNDSSSLAYAWGDQLVEDLTGYEYESRGYARTKLTSEIAARATNGSASEFGTPFSAITTDISASGLGFLHTTAVPDKFLALTLGYNGRRLVVLVEVMRCRSVSNLYEIGVKFIRQLTNIE